VGINLGEKNSLELFLRKGSELIYSLLVGMARVGVVLLDRFEVFLKDAKTIFNLLRRELEVNHMPIFDPPFFKEFCSGLYLFVFVEEKQGGEG
jgi:hypothetical protein